MITIMIITLISASFVACGDDDDKDNNGNNGGGTSGGGGTSATVTKADVVGSWYMIDEQSDTRICVVGITFNANGTGLFAQYKAKAKNDWKTELEEYDITWKLDGQTLTMNNGREDMKAELLSKTDSTINVKRYLEEGTDVATIYRAKNADQAYKVFEAIIKGEYNSGENGGGNNQTGGSSVFDANGLTFNFSSTNGYWMADEGTFYVQMFNCDLYKAIENEDIEMFNRMPSNLQMITIGFKTDGTLKGMTTGKFSPFYVIISSIKKDNFLQGDSHADAEYEAEAYEGEVTITRDGSQYTVSFGSVEFIDALGKGNKSFTINGFSWTGSMYEVPEFMQDNADARFGRLF